MQHVAIRSRTSFSFTKQKIMLKNLGNCKFILNISPFKMRLLDLYASFNQNLFFAVLTESLSEGVFSK